MYMYVLRSSKYFMVNTYQRLVGIKSGCQGHGLYSVNKEESLAGIKLPDK